MNKQVDLTFQVQPGTISWRDSISIHPAADLFPMMTADELKALGEDIKKNGLTSPIAIAVFLDPDHNEPILLDGRNRLDAMEHVGLQVGIVRPMTRKESWSLIAKENQSGNWYQINITKRIGATVTVVTSDPVEYITSANINRRHLMAEAKRDLIAKLLKEHPERSNRATAELVKVDHKTVAAVRRLEEDVGSIPHVVNVVDSKGRQQPARKPKPVTVKEEIKTTKVSPLPDSDRLAAVVAAATECLGGRVAISNASRSCRSRRPDTKAMPGKKAYRPT
jgi:hypothetical protein